MSMNKSLFVVRKLNNAGGMIHPPHVFQQSLDGGKKIKILLCEVNPGRQQFAERRTSASSALLTYKGSETDRPSAVMHAS